MGNITSKYDEEPEPARVSCLMHSREIVLKPLIDRYQEWFNDEKNTSLMMPVGDRYLKLLEEINNLEETLENLGYRLHRVYNNLEDVETTGEETEVNEIREVKEMYLTLANYWEINVLNV